MENHINAKELGMNATKPISAGALYYPYIHINDLNWLRANLLIFPCIKRMVPMNFTPRDSAGVTEFTQWWGSKEPLLQSADLWTDRSQQAQGGLASKLRQDSENEAFLTRYGREAARKLADANAYGFQIHAEKLSDELREALMTDKKLAWEPLNCETYDTDSGYIEVHPRVGEAVMSTLAVACAQASGLDIVGDERSGPLHRCLLEKDLKRIYESWLDTSIEMDDPHAASGEELLEFILGIPGDLSALSVEKLHQIAAEREPIDTLITTLREQAAKIPTMDDGKDRENAFKQAASDVMEKWKSDRKNLSGFAREFFSLDAATLATSFASKVADKTFTGMAAGAATKATVTAAAVAGSSSAGWLGSLAAGGIIGAGAGLIIGLIAHAGKTYFKQVQREKDSPYRFLTTLEDAGVVFRSAAF
jgi:hypothetical protein